MVDKQKLLKKLLQNERINNIVNKLELNQEQLEDALPILIDMASEKDDQTSEYLTSLTVVNKQVKRIYERSTFYQQFAYLDNIITQHYEKINFEDDKQFIQEVGRKKAMLEMSKIWKEVNKNPERGLYLYGDIGIGKTFILKRFAKKFAQENWKVAFLTTNTLMQVVKDSFATNDNQSEIIAILKTVDCLFLDDIGAEAINPWFRDEILFNILNSRMNQKRLTFFSANYSLQKLIEVQSRNSRQAFRDWDKAKRLVSRIEALALPIEVTGQNKRY